MGGKLSTSLQCIYAHLYAQEQLIMNKSSEIIQE